MTSRPATTLLSLGMTAAAMLMLLALVASPPAHAQTQVPLTASYSIVGSSPSNVEDLLTYVSEGVVQVATLSGTPTVYMVDSGTQWSVLTVLSGSTASERWITNQYVEGTIGGPLTVAPAYYQQYYVSFDYNVTNGGSGFSSPSVSYETMGAPAYIVAPDTVWADASSSYTYETLLPGSAPSQRWAATGVISGAIAASGTITVTYDHQFLVSSSYSVVGGGSPEPPVLSSTLVGAAYELTMTTSTQQTWLDANANYTFTESLAATGTSSTGQAWTGTVLEQTPSGAVLTMDNNGTVDSPLSITPVYYHQFLVNVDFAYVGGNITGYTAPTFAYEHFGSEQAANSSSAVWVDSGTKYNLTETICCTQSPGSERWQLYNSTTGTIHSATTISSTYFYQYDETFSYSVIGEQPSSSVSAPGLVYEAGGNSLQLSLSLTPQSFWADANSTYTVAATLSVSSSSERWFTTSATGAMQGPGSAATVDVAYTQQYLLTIQGGAIPTEWVNAGANSTISTPGVFGRSDGTGHRVVSYQIDSGGVVTISQPALVLSVPIQMEGPHTVYFQTVVQFQVSLDEGAAGGLHYITPPTIPGDDYWYDAGSQVQVVLNGTWGRHGGVGQRIIAISATAEPAMQVDTVGTVQAYSTDELDSPVTITTTSTTQYEVVLNTAALAAFSSISPNSTFAGDTFWYDAGSPAVTVVLHGIYSRSAGTGFRTSSYQLDAGTITKVATTGAITITTKAMNAPQFVNTTSVAQYEVTIDKGGEAALSSLTNPSIPLDSGWYDASTPVGLVVNGVWDRGSGTGERLAGYSTNGGAEVPVNSTGLVTVLNLVGISSPETITTTVVTQYQVVLDAGAAASLSSMTPTPIPKDNYWYDGGTSVNVTLNAVWGRTSTSGSRLISYSVNQGPSVAVTSSSPVRVLSLSVISAPESVTTKTANQFHLTSTPIAPLSLTGSTLPGDAPGWYDAGTTVKAVYGLVWNQTSTGSRESVESYSVDGGARTSVQRAGTGNFTVTLAMSQAQSIAVTSVTQYLVSVAGPQKATGTPPSPTGDSYFDSGTKVTFTVPRAWNGTSEGVRDVLVSYSVDGAPPVQVPTSNSTAFSTPALTIVEPVNLTFEGSPQYLVSFQFFDGFGTTPVVPSQVQLGIGNSTAALQGTSEWFANGTSFRVLSVIWEGASVGPTPAASFEVKAAPLNVTLDTMVYAASVKAVDLFGLPVSGAQVSMTLANGTTVVGTTKSDGVFEAGMIPVGTFTAKVSSLGTSVQVVGDAATPGAVPEGRVLFGLTSLFAIVVVAVGSASGAVLGLRWSKRRRAARRVSEPK